MILLMVIVNKSSITNSQCVLVIMTATHLL